MNPDTARDGVEQSFTSYRAFSPTGGGYWCGCGQWVVAGHAHTCVNYVQIHQQNDPTLVAILFRLNEIAETLEEIKQLLVKERDDGH